MCFKVCQGPKMVVKHTGILYLCSCYSCSWFSHSCPKCRGYGGLVATALHHHTFLLMSLPENNPRLDAQCTFTLGPSCCDRQWLPTSCPIHSHHTALEQIFTCGFPLFFFSAAFLFRREKLIGRIQKHAFPSPRSCCIYYF